MTGDDNYEALLLTVRQRFWGSTWWVWVAATVGIGAASFAFDTIAGCGFVVAAALGYLCADTAAAGRAARDREGAYEAGYDHGAEVAPDEHSLTADDWRNLREARSRAQSRPANLGPWESGPAPGGL